MQGFHLWNFLTRTFASPWLQDPRWLIRSLAPKSTSLGSSPRFWPSQFLSSDQKELCRISVPWKWWRGYILSLKPQRIISEKRTQWVCILRPTSVLFCSVSSEVILGFHMTSPKFKLRNYRFSGVFTDSWGITTVKTCIHTNFGFERVLRRLFLG